MERTPEEQWVMARLDAIAPTWTPNVAQARIGLAEIPRRRRAWLRYGVAACVAAACVIVAVAVPVRTIAQDLWYRFAVSRVDVVRLDFSNVPLDTSIRADGMQTAVASVDEAGRLAGFTPSLPSADVAPGTSTLSVTSRIAVTQRLHTKALREALARVGAADLDVPGAWNGAELEAAIGPLVIAEYPGDVSIVQAPPIQMRVPAHISLARVAEVMFRAAGSSRWEARLLGDAYAESPALLLDIPQKDAASVETMAMGDGSPGIVVDDFDEHGAGRSTVLVSRPKKILAVSSPSRGTSVRIAEAMLR